MFWNKKEDDKKLPDLPPYQPINAKPEIVENDFPQDHENDENDDSDVDNDRHYLPSFPDSPTKKGFSQSAIKDAVSTDDISYTEENEMPANKKFKTIEMTDFSDNSNKMTMDSFSLERRNIPEPRIPTFEQPSPPIAKQPSFKPQEKDKSVKSRDIFVKIDRFHSARKSLELIKSKVSEIEDLLKRIRETKLREEQELSSWEKEINSVKSKIQEVNENIFERLE